MIKRYSNTVKLTSLARRTGVTVATIRYYEEVGLMPRPDRRDSGHRVYYEDDVPRLLFIKRCRAIGFSVDKICALVRGMQAQDPSCIEVRETAENQLTELRTELVEMRALEQTLMGFLRDWDSAWVPRPFDNVGTAGHNLAAHSDDQAATAKLDIPRAIFADRPTDFTNPAAIRVASIRSEGQNINAVVYVPTGKGPHPIAILLHGFRANEQNGDLAQLLRRAGWTVVTFHVRGTWGSEGKFSFEGSGKDVRAVLAACRSQKFARSWRADPRRIVVIGHGTGGFAAADICAGDAEIMGCALLAPRDPGLDARLTASMTTSQRIRYAAHQFAGVEGPSARQLVDQFIAEGTKWRMSEFALALASRPILIVMANRDRGQRVPELIPALQEASATKLRIVRFEADGDFNNLRIGLGTVLLEWMGALQGAPRDTEIIGLPGQAEERVMSNPAG